MRLLPLFFAAAHTAPGTARPGVSTQAGHGGAKPSAVAAAPQHPDDVLLKGRQ